MQSLGFLQCGRGGITTPSAPSFDQDTMVEMQRFVAEIVASREVVW